MKKLISMILITGLIFGFSSPAFGSINRGDPKTTYDQRVNLNHRNMGGNDASWLARSKNSNGKVLWLDGSITDPSMDAVVEPLDITLWLVGGQGGSHDNYTVTYLSPTLWTADQVIVYYDLLSGTVVSAKRQIQETDGSFTTTDVPVSSLTHAEYCTGYGCIS